MFWALPNTLIGLLLVAISKSKHVKSHVPAMVFEPGTWLGRYMKKHYWAGLTLGHVVFMVDPNDHLIACHELIHVYQNNHFGPFWLPLYGIFSLVMWLIPGKKYYRDNPFERQAYTRQDFGCGQTTQKK